MPEIVTYEVTQTRKVRVNANCLGAAIKWADAAITNSRLPNPEEEWGGILSDVSLVETIIKREDYKR